MRKAAFRPSPVRLFLSLLCMGVLLAADAHAQASPQPSIGLKGLARFLSLSQPNLNPDDLAVGYGSGFFVTSTGEVVTSFHVVKGHGSIAVMTSDGQWHAARLAAYDAHNDVALLKADLVSSPIPMAGQLDVHKGDEVTILGYPRPAAQGLEQKATFGRVNSLTGFAGDPRLVQIDCPVQPGHSGGPLINAKGRVVGVVTSKLGLSPHDTISTLPENVNYAIKSAYVLPLVENRNVVMVTLVGPAKKPAGVRKPDDVKNLVEVYEKSVVLVASLTLLPARDARRTVEDQPADSPAGSRVAANGAKGAAVPAAKAVSKEDAKKAQEWLKRSQQDLGKHDWAEAIRTTSAAMALDPGLDDAYANRAWAYTEKGLIEQAVADCDAALGINPGNATARNNKGLALLRAGKGEEALPFFETGCGQGLTIACENYKAVTGYDLSKKEEYLLDKSSEHFLERKWSDVVTVADQVLMINSRNHVALANRCGAESYLGALDDALADCSRAIAANPDYPLAYNNRGFVMELQGKKIQAAIDYEISCTHGLPLGCRNLERLQQE